MAIPILLNTHHYFYTYCTLIADHRLDLKSPSKCLQGSLCSGHPILYLLKRWYTGFYKNQKFDIELFLQDHSLDTITAGPEKISNMAKDSRGVLMIEPWHKFIPFPLKWFPYTRKLFYRNLKTFPGADNCMLFNRTVCDQGIFFRPRNERTWGTPAGRGSGRDFVFKVAQKFNNNYYFKLPLYLWDVKIENSEHQNNYKYLKS